MWDFVSVNIGLDWLVMDIKKTECKFLLDS